MVNAEPRTSNPEPETLNPEPRILFDVLHAHAVFLVGRRADEFFDVGLVQGFGFFEGLGQGVEFVAVAGQKINGLVGGLVQDAGDFLVDHLGRVFAVAAGFGHLLAQEGMIFAVAEGHRAQADRSCPSR